jgi:hypothetical protein
MGIYNRFVQQVGVFVLPIFVITNFSGAVHSQKKWIRSTPCGASRGRWSGLR